MCQSKHYGAHSSDVSITAVFDAIDYTVDISSYTNGTVSVDKSTACRCTNPAGLGMEPGSYAPEYS